MNKLDKKAKVLYVLGSKFPTPKAYGVTCRETVEVLLGLSHETRILSYLSDYTDIDFLTVNSKIISIRTIYATRLLRNFGVKSTGTFHKAAWKLSLIINLRLNNRLVNEYSPNIFWTRNSEIANYYLRKYPNSYVILELHQRGSDKSFKKLRKFDTNLVICPINSHLYRSLEKFQFRCEIVKAPMSISEKLVVNNDAIMTFQNILESRKSSGLKIGYIGKFFPGGYSKGIEDLLYLAKIYSNLHSNNMVILTGGDKNEVAQLKQIAAKLAIAEKNLIISGHVRHSMAIELMKTMDVLVLPLPVTDSYDGTPIKTLEYCASGKIVVAADAKLYREVFTSSFTPFWYAATNADSLYQAIECAVSDLNLHERILAGVQFASQHTWQKRTEKILEKVTL